MRLYVRHVLIHLRETEVTFTLEAVSSFARKLQMAEMPLTTITPFRVPSLLIRDSWQSKMGPSHVICCLISQEQINFVPVPCCVMKLSWGRRELSCFVGVENLIPQKKEHLIDFLHLNSFKITLIFWFFLTKGILLFVMKTFLEKFSKLSNKWNQLT